MDCFSCTGTLIPIIVLVIIIKILSQTCQFMRYSYYKNLIILMGQVVRATMPVYYSQTSFDIVYENYDVEV